MRDYLVARYGDFVLLKPPFKPETLLLWGAPFAVLLLGATGLLMASAIRADAAAAPLDPPRSGPSWTH